jgi:predicted O-methyltransferase YrrM
MSLEDIKKKAIEEHIPILMDETLDVITECFAKEKTKSILEIGTAVGYSAICFANCIGKDAKIDTIELDEQRANQAIQNIKDLELTENINVIVGNAVEVLPTINKEYDAVFIDAAKGKYPFFLREAIRLTKINGIIFADNVLYKGYVLSDYNKHKQRTAVRHLREYLADIIENENLETQVSTVGDGLAISIVK